LYASSDIIVILKSGKARETGHVERTEDSKNANTFWERKYEVFGLKYLGVSWEDNTKMNLKEIR
jgi:hypothetical protein